MPYTMEDFERDAREDFLNELTPEQRLKGLSPEQLLAHLSAEQRLQGLPLQEIKNYMKKLKIALDKPSSDPSKPQG